jgi:glycosyltransferase involved in cell wall biosynthesis
LRANVSLIATVKDEAGSIGGFLDGLLAQSRPPEEIVLADGGSTDGTIAAIEAARDRSAVPIRLLEAPGTNISEGRNVAIAEASHELIAVTDAGTRPRPDWLEKLVAPLERDPGTGVAAGFFLPGGEGWRQRTLAIAITPQRHEIDPAAFLPSSRSIAFRRACWKQAGGYPEWLRHCEDLVFDIELRRTGASFAFVPDAIVVWDARPDLRSFARQYFNYARGDGHANLWPKRHLLRYAAYLVGPFLLTRRRHRRLARGALLAGWLAYQAKFFRRLVRIPPSASPVERLGGFARVPLIVSVGDLAKMVGYAVGTVERRSRRP